MPIPDTAGVPPFADFDMLKSKINEIVQKYNNLMLNLDSLNVVSLTADHVDTGTLDAGKVTIKVDYATGASITLDSNGMTIFDGTKDTFQVDINGNVTMTSATVQSAAGYPKVIMDPNGNLVGAYLDANNYIVFSPYYLGSPALNFFNNGVMRGQVVSTSSGLQVSGTKLVLSSNGGNLSLSPATGYVTEVDNWSELYSADQDQSLQTALNAKTDLTYARSTFAANMTFDPVTRNLKLFNADGTQIAIVNIP